MERACLDDRVGHRGQALVVGLDYYCKAACIRANQRGKVGDQMDGREVVGVRYLQRLQQAAQSIVAEAQRLGCIFTNETPFPFLSLLLFSLKNGVQQKRSILATQSPTRTHSLSFFCCFFTTRVQCNSIDASPDAIQTPYRWESRTRAVADWHGPACMSRTLSEPLQLTTATESYQSPIRTASSLHFEQSPIH